MDLARYYIALMFTVAMLPAVLVWIFIHPFAEKWRKIGLIGTYIFITAFVALGIFLLWLARGWILTIEFGFNKFLSVLAVIFFCLSIFLGIMWRRVFSGWTVIGVPEIAGRDNSGELVTEGIYSYIRHPRYLEIGMVAVAAALFSNYLAAYIVVLVYIPLIHIVALLEERELRNRFGKAYEEYCSRVPRFIPRIRSQLDRKK